MIIEKIAGKNLAPDRPNVWSKIDEEVIRMIRNRRKRKF